MRHFLLAATLCAMLSGCVGPTIGQYQLVALNKGMSTTEVQLKLEQQPRGSVVASIDNRSFSVSRYLFNNGMQNDLYYLAYEDAKLIYWGYSSDFRRHPDKAMGKLMDETIPKFGSLR
jgi:hypothetical protein